MSEKKEKKKGGKPLHQRGELPAAGGPGLDVGAVTEQENVGVAVHVVAVVVAVGADQRRVDLKTTPNKLVVTSDCTNQHPMSE